jgi:subtilase family serine protease
MQFINYFAASFAIALISIPTLAQSPPTRQVLEGHVPPALARLHLQPIGKLPTTNRLNLAIGLPLRNRNSFDELMAQIYDPASPNFRHYLTPDQFAEQFGPAEADYTAVMAFAKTNGLTVTGTCSDRTIVNVSGSVADIERIFHVTMRQYRHPRENRNFFAPDVEPSIDLPVPILHISGLDNFVVPHPASLKIIPAARAATIKPAYGTSPLGTFMGKDFRAAYVPRVSLNGSNQVVGLLELDGYYTNDITTYESIAGLPSVTLSNVLMGGASGTPGNANNEVALDIEMAISMATNLSKVIVYEGPNPISNSDIANLLDSMATNNVAKQISCSWIIGDDPNFDIKYVQFAVQGQSFFQASGDDGTYYSGSQSADDTNITLVGGTTLSTTGAGGPYAAETVWNEYVNGESATGGGGGSGGGISPAGYIIPSWQTGVATTTNQASPTLRNSPDVAMNADNIFVIADNGQQESLTGTSAAAPLWAGFTALVNQQAVASGKATVGFINPAIYAIGKSPFYLVDFHDITTGNNTNLTVGNNYFAVPGYDLCTGWGTPAGQNMIIALATPDNLGVLPGTGFTANGPVGGPFNVSSEKFMLTNSGTVSLNWSAVAPSWLTVAPGSGTLAAKSSVQVSIGLNSTINNLVPATYAASVAFTNLSSGIAQIRPFTLQLGQSIVQNGGFENGDFSQWNFTGDYTDSSGSFENGAVGTNTFSDGSGPDFIHSGAYGAAFGEPGMLAYLSQTLPTSPGQGYLLSFWMNNIGGATPNQFVINWNTNSTVTSTIFNQVNVPAINNWSNYQFVVTAGATNTVLQFGFENDNYYFGLDDISVQPAPAPSFRTVSATNNLIRFTWNSLAGLAYQLQYSTNLAGAGWLNLGNTVTATNYTSAAAFSIGTDSQHFYRVQWTH